jgi:hypothetical protein
MSVLRALARTAAARLSVIGQPSNFTGYRWSF